LGYETTFFGAISVVPALNKQEIAYLRRFAASRRMDRELGPYFCSANYFGAHSDPDIRDHNRPGPDQPGLWCKWEPTDDGASIVWNKAEKFYDAEKWMAYLVRTFLAPDASLASELAAPLDGRYYADEFAFFTFDHVLNGVIDAEGEEDDDVWQLVVEDNLVTVRYADGDAQPVIDTGPR
jgi:hypothetical protein